jgi:hypothetical protein
MASSVNPLLRAWDRLVNDQADSFVLPAVRAARKKLYKHYLAIAAQAWGIHEEWRNDESLASTLLITGRIPEMYILPVYAFICNYSDVQTRSIGTGWKAYKDKLRQRLAANRMSGRSARDAQNYSDIELCYSILVS